MQASYLLETAHTVYALDISKVFAQKQYLANAHFKISTHWHRALQFTSTNESQKELADKGPRNITY
jgi:hypothetical protein